MPIKKLTVSFDVPIATFLSMIAAGNSAMKIDVFGDDHTPKQRRLNGHAPKLLEGPKKGHNRDARAKDASGNIVSGRNVILHLLAKNKDRHVDTAEIKQAYGNAGLNGPSNSPQLHALKKHGLVKRVGPGLYTITAKGLSEFAKQEAAHG